jgi:two-component system, NtrC family, sensor kinase
MAALGTLCAGVAHEANNPLSYVITNLRYLSEELPRMLREGVNAASSVEDVEQTIADALEGATRLGQIIQDLRSYAHASTEPSEVVDVRAALERAIALLRADLRRRGRMYTDYEGPCLARASEAAVAHVVLTVLTHAVRALPESSAAQHEVRLACRSAAERVELDVLFTVGVGETGPSASTEEELDLAVCRGVVEALGGALTIQRSADATTIHVAFPESARGRESLPPRAA